MGLVWQKQDLGIFFFTRGTKMRIPPYICYTIMLGFLISFTGSEILVSNLQEKFP